MTMIVAEITEDHLYDGSIIDWNETGRKFELDALRQHFMESISADIFNKSKRIKFRAYDDDGVLYYTGWLINDDGSCYVQQFILAWGGPYSGVTTVTVNRDDGKGWVQEIG